MTRHLQADYQEPGSAPEPYARQLLYLFFTCDYLRYLRKKQSVIHLQADYQEPGSAPEPYARQLSIGYLYFFLLVIIYVISEKNNL